MVPPRHQKTSTRSQCVISQNTAYSHLCENLKFHIERYFTLFFIKVFQNYKINILFLIIHRHTYLKKEVMQQTFVVIADGGKGIWLHGCASVWREQIALRTHSIFESAASQPTRKHNPLASSQTSRSKKDAKKRNCTV